MNKDRPNELNEPAALYGAYPKQKRRPEIGRTVARIRQGLPMEEFETLQKMLALTAEELATHLGISRSTLLRRRKAGHLDMQESDRLVRFTRLFARAIEVLGGHANARHWLRTPARALEFASPLHFAETETGAREVERLLGRIEYGVFS